MLDVKFPKNHKITEAKNLWDTIDSVNSSLPSRYVHYLFQEDSDWLEKTLSVKNSLIEVCAKLNDIKASYPMLIHFATHYSSWRGMDKGLEKDVLDYISLCDEPRGEGE